MLLVDDRFMRGHQAFLSSDELRCKEGQSRLVQKGISPSDVIQYDREYNRLLAKEIERFISDIVRNSRERVDLELSIAEKVIEISRHYTS